MNKKLILAAALLASMSLAGCNWGKPSDEVRIQKQTPPASSPSNLPDINSPSGEINTGDTSTGDEITGDNTQIMTGKNESTSGTTLTGSRSGTNERDVEGEDDFSQQPSAE